MARVSHRTMLPLLASLLLAGCATVPLDSARRNFNVGRLDVADQELANIPDNADRVLNLMERGMIKHVRRDYVNSTRDWLEAIRLEKELETHSASKAGASMVVNDNVLNFRGYPYERTYLHVFLAKNYLAQGLWEDAGVEARSIALRQEKLEGFPDDAYSHYLAGFCLELCGDDSNAAMQYRQAAKLVPELGINDKTGTFGDPSITNAPSNGPRTGFELVCFLDIDGGDGMMPDHAEVHINGKFSGISHTLVDIARLNYESSQRMATRKAAKTITRLALKGAAAIAVSSENKDLGNLLWLWALASEQEDTRRWETLPARLAVARVPCPENPDHVEIVFKSYAGTPVRQIILAHPLMRKNRLYVAICRDFP